MLFDIDTLRADHVSGYGYKVPTTPQLDRYFQGWLRAETCLPAANWTLPSHASLFLSQSVARHGVGRVGRLLPSGVETLAAAVGRAGYRTLAVTGGGFVDPAFGFARGFDRYAVLEKPAREAVAKALAMLDEHRGEPVFLFLHTYQVHDYMPEDSVARKLFGSLEPLGPDWPGTAGALAGTRGADPGFPGWIRARYDAALRSVDDAFGRLLEGLARSGRLSDTAIVFTSDHGEALCGHDWKGQCLGWTHGNPYLYEEEIAVPLQIRIPWKPQARGTLRNVVSLLDVAPTVAEAVGVPAPASFEGRSLFSGEPPADRSVATEAPPLDALALRVGRYKLIRRTGAPQNAWFGKSSYRILPAEECLDLSKDPAEKHPAPCDSAWGRSLRERTDRYLVTGFSDSLVLRVPPAVLGSGGRQLLVRARGPGGPPALRTFGLAGRTAVLEQAGAETRARFSSGAAPVWLAFEPFGGSQAVEVEIDGERVLLSAAGGAIAAGSYPWGQLRWAARTGAARGPDGLHHAPPGRRRGGCDAAVERNPHAPARPRVSQRLAGAAAGPAVVFSGVRRRRTGAVARAGKDPPCRIGAWRRSCSSRRPAPAGRRPTRRSRRGACNARIPVRRGPSRRSSPPRRARARSSSASPTAGPPSRCSARAFPRATRSSGPGAACRRRSAAAAC